MAKMLRWAMTPWRLICRYQANEADSLLYFLGGGTLQGSVCFSSHNAPPKRCEIIKMSGDTSEQQFTFEWAACVCGNQRASSPSHTSHYDVPTLTGNKGANGLLAACFPMRNTDWRDSQQQLPPHGEAMDSQPQPQKMFPIQRHKIIVGITQMTRRRSLLKFEFVFPSVEPRQTSRARTFCSFMV